MPVREKVINKVTAIVADMQEEVDEWKDYSDSELRGGLTCDCDWWYKTLQTLKDALALLKAQEPRVMTLEEYEAWIDTPFTERNPVFHEERTKRGTVTCWVDTVVCTLREYGKNDRCWTSRPTDEQREATPWE
jgi:hypothetical protein